MTLEEIDAQFESALHDAKWFGKDARLAAWAQMHGLKFIVIAKAAKHFRDYTKFDNGKPLHLLFELLDKLEK